MHKRGNFFDYPRKGRAVRLGRGAVALLVMLAGCRSQGVPMNSAQLHDFAARYTAAWCSQDSASVAAFFEIGGSLKINSGAPAVGRAAISAAAQGFMSAFPDLVIVMDGISMEKRHAEYRWTLTGTNTGPGGTGKAVRISGHEEWTIAADGLIAESNGHFDEAEYERQLKLGTPGS